MESVSTLLNTEPMDWHLWRDVLTLDPCAYCGLPADQNKYPEIDHITPTSMGGDNTTDNLTGACRHCNRTKRTRSVLSLLHGGRIGPQLARPVIKHPRRPSPSVPTPRPKLTEDEITREIRCRLAAKIAWLPAIPRYEHDKVWATAA